MKSKNKYEYYIVNLREVRKARGIAQREFARALGCTHETVNRWEMNRRGISAGYLEKVCELLGLNVADSVKLRIRKPKIIE